MIGVIADDITGSNDIGVMFRSSGYSADVHSFSRNVLDEILADRPDVLIFDTDSRLDDARTAYEKVFQATKSMQKAGAYQFFNKTCSVFRGNIGAEFDAMLDALEEEFAVVVVGFPKNGRLTENSIHYVNGTALASSQFKNDPVHPMTESDLTEILKNQTERKVGALHHNVLSQGREVLRDEIRRVKNSGEVNYLILDVTSQEDLAKIAFAVQDEKILCGSSALGEEIPKVKAKESKGDNELPFPEWMEGKGLFCAAGSLTPQTIGQVAYMKEQGFHTVEFDTLSFLRHADPDTVISELKEAITTKMVQGHHVILHSSNDPEKVRETKEDGLKQGYDNTAVSRLISDQIAEITLNVLERTGQRRFVIAGGDTSAKVCQALGIKGIRIWKEIQPGVPSCLSHKTPPYLFVLKSGSFGSPDFIELAFDHLSE
ncbi:four-carbon acid sugar kinase family protein [Thalassobacillus pellis]|uniref:four-carbon acid sugar kinase family protein n=1 Tax=Thalassobacillus pellis TaxID=748008 RepID=UPI0019601D74|nr:four-carbon acid sugar kinase family protein [Thalassobacillus pellis]MBM7551539.1 uncharacterized protein YgbK (DUF1537 family) [Thalassobacillus pellis]